MSLSTSTIAYRFPLYWHPIPSISPCFKQKFIPNINNALKDQKLNFGYILSKKYIHREQLIVKKACHIGYTSRRCSSRDWSPDNAGSNTVHYFSETSPKRPTSSRKQKVRSHRSWRLTRVEVLRSWSAEADGKEQSCDSPRIHRFSVATVTVVCDLSELLVLCSRRWSVLKSSQVSRADAARGWMSGKPAARPR